jgi:hypothetical protein
MIRAFRAHCQLQTLEAASLADMSPQTGAAMALPVSKSTHICKAQSPRRFSTSLQLGSFTFFLVWLYSSKGAPMTRSTTEGAE